MRAVNMQYHRYLSIILILMYVFDCNYSLNVDELQLLNCKVDIMESPIKKGEEPSGSVVHVPSTEGYDYSCVLPEVEEEGNMTLDENSTDAKELLKSMPCLSKETGWWTAKVCFGRDIQQYHVKDNRIASYVIMLGFYHSDSDWSNDIDQDKFIHGKQRHYSQYYVNGTECGYYVNNGTGQLRSAEVRFYCEEGVEDYISQVEEPVTCRYVITVRTSRLCTHPRFRPPKRASPVPCHPLLDEEQFDSYMDKLNGV